MFVADKRMLNYCVRCVDDKPACRSSAHLPGVLRAFALRFARQASVRAMQYARPAVQSVRGSLAGQGTCGW